MTSISILNLPPELLHCIFDRCDTYTIFHSIRYVCKLLHQTVNSYKAHTLDFTGDSSYDFKLILRLTPIESVTSLAISDGRKKEGRLAKFISHIGCQKFKNMHSLALYQADYSELNQLLKNMIPESLFSLSLDFRERSYFETVDAISSVLSRLNLRKLCVNCDEGDITRVSYPKNCSLECLTINQCSYTEYPIILGLLPNLQKLIINDWCKPSYNDKLISPSELKFQPPLTSLTINQTRLEYHGLSRLLLYAPAIRHLGLVNEYASLDLFVDFSPWEKFISKNLPCLINFKFLFSHEFSSDEVVPSLDKIIAQFRTSFWLDVKRWIVICEYDFGKKSLQLYTPSMNRTKKSNVFIVSSKENIYTYFESIGDRKVRNPWKI